MSNPIVLLDNAAATGGEQFWPGGIGEWAAEGNFNGATLTLEKKTPLGTWFPVDAGAVLSANGRIGFAAGQGMIRVAISGSPTGMHSWAMHFG